MNIRTERKEDFQEIYELIQMTFQTAKISDGDEQDFANNLRNTPNYLVAENGDRLIGHIMLTKIYVEQLEGLFEALLLAPVSVLLEHKDRGVGYI